MSIQLMSNHAATHESQPQGTPSTPEVNERLCHLFRASLKYGRIHPLYLPILRYRHSQSGT